MLDKILTWTLGCCCCALGVAMYVILALCVNEITTLRNRVRVLETRPVVEKQVTMHDVFFTEGEWGRREDDTKT